MTQTPRHRNAQQLPPHTTRRNRKPFINMFYMYSLLAKQHPHAKLSTKYKPLRTAVSATAAPSPRVPAAARLCCSSGAGSSSGAERQDPAGLADSVQRVPGRTGRAGGGGAHPPRGLPVTVAAGPGAAPAAGRSRLRNTPESPPSEVPPKRQPVAHATTPYGRVPKQKPVRTPTLSSQCLRCSRVFGRRKQEHRAAGAGAGLHDVHLLSLREVEDLFGSRADDLVVLADGEQRLERKTGRRQDRPRSPTARPAPGPRCLPSPRPAPGLTL